MAAVHLDSVRDVLIDAPVPHHLETLAAETDDLSVGYGPFLTRLLIAGSGSLAPILKSSDREC
jgi:hypothetical protein